MRAAANAKRESLSEGDGTAEALDAVRDMEEFAEMARLVGTETVAGRTAFHLRVDGLNLVQEVEGGGKGGEFTLQTVNLWIDTEQYVPLRLKTDGVHKSGKKTTPITVERFDSAYQEVAGSNLFESHRQILRFIVKDPKQVKELQEAQQQMAEMEKQLKQLPQAQQEMIRKRMGPQMETMRKMAAGEGIVVETLVHEIRVNAGLPDRLEMGQKALAVSP